MSGLIIPPYSKFQERNFNDLKGLDIQEARSTGTSKEHSRSASSGEESNAGSKRVALVMQDANMLLDPVELVHFRQCLESCSLKYMVLFV